MGFKLETTAPPPYAHSQHESKREVRKSLSQAFEKIHDEDMGCVTSSCADERTNIPAKKVRSFSPDNYVEYVPMNIETCENTKVSAEIDSRRSNEMITVVDEPPRSEPIRIEPAISRPRSCEQVVDDDDEHTDSKSAAVVFQLVAVPRQDCEPTPNDRSTVTETLDNHSVDATVDTFSSTATDSFHPVREKPSDIKPSHQVTSTNHDYSDDDDNDHD